MDVSPVGQITLSEPDSLCHVCGYSRRGLPPSALCPECGQPPPAEIEPVLRLVGAAKDRAEQAWLGSVALGLVTLFVTSILALQVILIMPLGGLVLTAMNAPAPKLSAAALLMRSIGQPGSWGVMGTLAVLGSVLGVWLVTERRTALDAAEPLLSRRRLARWSSAIGCGLMLGWLLSGRYISGHWGWDALPVLAAAVGVVELVANTLLYRYLAQIAERFDTGLPGKARGATLLSVGAGCVALLCAVGAVMSLIRGYFEDHPIVMWRFLQCAYGALAVSGGMIMTAGVLYLLGKVLAAATDQSLVSLAGRVSRLPAALGRVGGAIRSDPQRWMTVAGLVLWLYLARPMVGLTALMEHRTGLGGDLPALNFIGPKVWAVPLMSDRYRYYWSPENRLAVLAVVLAMWMISTLRARGVDDRWRQATRWAPTILIGLALGLQMTIEQASLSVRTSHWVSGMMLVIEAPMTLLVYWYLSKLAGAMGETVQSRRLRLIALAATFLILSPLVFYVLARPLQEYRNGPVVLSIGAAYGAVVVGIGILAWAAIVRLAWSLGGASRLSSSADDPRLANPAPQ